MTMTSGFEFRESVPDAGDYFALFETTGWNRDLGLTAVELQNALQRSWYLLTAYDGEKLVGTGRIVSDGVFHGLIVDVIISPAYQRRGLGTTIMRRLLDRCRTYRIRDLQLFCATGKAPFYQRLGFAPRPADAPGMDLPKELLASSVSAEAPIC